LIPATADAQPPFHLIADSLTMGVGWLQID
jgi:hypothetical protein